MFHEMFTVKTLLTSTSSYTPVCQTFAEHVVFHLSFEDANSEVTLLQKGENV